MTRERLRDGDEILSRQIHPSFLVDGHVASSPFAPSAKDDNRLSVDRSSITTAASSFELYTHNGYQSIAVYGLKVGEFESEGIPCHSDPLSATSTQKANPAHAYADYTGAGTNQSKKIAKRLRNYAVTRGCLHPLA
jgi:hypothetical protein